MSGLFYIYLCCIFEWRQLHYIFSFADLMRQTQFATVKHNTTSKIQANQSLLFLLNAACLAEKHQIPILKSCLTKQGSNQRYTAIAVSTLTITPPMPFYFISIIILRPFNILTKCNIQLVRNVYFVRHTQEVSQILIELVQWNGRCNELSRQALFHWSMTCTFCANLSLLTWYK